MNRPRSSKDRGIKPDWDGKVDLSEWTLTAIENMRDEFSKSLDALEKVLPDAWDLHRVALLAASEAVNQMLNEYSTVHINESSAKFEFFIDWENGPKFSVPILELVKESVEDRGGIEEPEVLDPLRKALVESLSLIDEYARKFKEMNADLAER